MNINSRIRVALGSAAVALGAMGLPAVSYAGSVTIIDTAQQVCSAFNSISMDPAGNLQINGCTSATTPPPTTNPVPACTISLSPSTVTAGGGATISANCTNGPITAYNWSPTTNFGPPMSGQSATLNFPSAGTYTYVVSGTNANGTGANSFGATVTVNPVSTGGGGSSGCAIQPAAFYDSLNTNQKQVTIDRNGYVALYLPIADHAGQQVILSTVQVNQQPLNLKVQISLSPCPGDFTANPPECRAWGTVYMGAVQLLAVSAASPVTGGTCQFQVGKQYYVNARNVAFDLTSPSCPSASCSEFLTNNTNF